MKKKNIKKVNGFSDFCNNAIAKKSIKKIKGGKGSGVIISDLDSM